MTQIQTRVCSKCKQEKLVSEFHKRANRYKSHCKECRKGEKKTPEKIKLYAENNKEKIKQNQKRYREKNKEAIKQKKKKHYQENKQEINRKNKEYVLKNIDKTKEYQKKYHEEKKESIRIVNGKLKKHKYHNDPEFRIKERISSLFRIQLTQQNIKKDKEFFKYTGISRQEYYDYLSKFTLWQDFVDNKGIDIDHIIPVSAYDFSDNEEIKKCWSPENLRLLPLYENRIAKRDKVDFKLIEQYNIQHLLPKGIKYV